MLVLHCHSKTTFVTVNPKRIDREHESEGNSKTTFVTVNQKLDRL